MVQILNPYVIITCVPIAILQTIAPFYPRLSNTEMLIRLIFRKNVEIINIYPATNFNQSRDFYSDLWIYTLYFIRSI